MDSIKIKLFGKFCNNWPLVKITLNDNIIFDGEIIKEKEIEIVENFHIDNTLSITHYGKSFGQAGIWDLTLDPEGKIVKDRAVEFRDISINEVSLKKYISHTPFVSDQVYHTDYFGHNGVWSLKFESPIYNWIIRTYIMPKYQPSQNHVDETSHNNLFDYSVDVSEIEKIENHLKEHEFINN